MFPTVDGKVVAGPTAVDLKDKNDWSVRPSAFSEVMRNAVAMYPPLEGLEPVAAYAGLRPAGRDGVNYLIERSPISSWLVNVAAIRSTGLSASLGIAMRVVDIVRAAGVDVGPEAALLEGPASVVEGPWWARTASYRGVVV